jgi:serine/threonine protein kinase
MLYVLGVGVHVFEEKKRDRHFVIPEKWLSSAVWFGLQVRNEKARRYLSSMRKKPSIPFTQKFPGIDPLALRLLERMLAFDPSQRPTATEALADPYFKGLAKVEREPAAQPISKMEFEFERRRVGMDDVRELIYREVSVQ